MPDPNYRALCAELLVLAEESISYRAQVNEAVRLIDRTRAALAQPEPVAPTDEELDELWAEIDGGGGGGAGSAGVSGASGGNGGNGVASSITGTSVSRAGGGGGGGTSSGGTAQAGGGNGGVQNGNGSNATVNTGGGGGGCGAGFNTAANGGAGGSGIVIVRYAI